jgi:hypothetical protein
MSTTAISLAVGKRAASNLSRGHLKTIRGLVQPPGAYPGGMHRMHVHPPPPQPERLVMRKDKAVGNKKKIIKIFLKSIKFFSVQFQFYF